MAISTDARRDAANIHDEETHVPERIRKLLALGALGACFGLAALFALLVFITIPRSNGGIDGTSATVTWISVAGVILALIAVHLLIAKRLWDGRPDTP